jgi:hypothetical protein
MSDTTQPNLPGQDQLAGSDSALFLEMFSGEVINAFDETNIMLPLVRTMRVGAGKSFQFPRIGKADASYHVRGENILDGTDYLNAIEHTSVSISLDKTLLAPVFVDDWDEAVKHFETSAEYAKQLGAALARTTDEQLLRVVALAAAASQFTDALNTGTGVGEGSSIILDGTTGLDTIRDGVVAAAIALAQKDVPMSEIVVAVSPEDYFALLNDDVLASADFSAQGNADRASGSIFKAYGFRVVMTPRLTGGLDNQAAAVTGEINDYTGDLREVRALAWDRRAVGHVVRKDVMLESEYKIERQGTLLVAKMLAGSGVLAAEAACRIMDDRFVV